MAALHPVLVVTDVPINGSGSPASHIVNSVEDWSITWSIGRPETISYKAVGADAATYLTPGKAPTGTRIVGPSLDNGVHQESRMLGGAAQWNLDNYPYISESGNGLGQVLATSRIGRMSVQQVTLGDVFTAAVGQIRQMASPRNTLTPTIRIPAVGGFSAVPIGPAGTTQATALAFSFVVDPSVTAAVIDLDSNRDTLLRAAETVTEHMGGTLDPFRAQFVIDSGDYGVVEGTAQAQTLTLGHKGSVSRLTFTSTGTGFPTQLILLGSSGESQVADQCYSCCFLGGDTHHGMPDGGSITAIKVLNRTWTDLGDYRVGMPILGIYVDRDHGGVYAWIGDGAMHPISQAMGVRDIWYDEVAQQVYAATDAGVYQGFNDPESAAQAPWPRLGKMALKVSKLCKDNGILYALVEYSDGATHVLRYPAVAGAGTGMGYDGWSPIRSISGISDFVVCGGMLYYIRSATGSQAVVHALRIGMSNSDKKLPIPPQTVAGDTVATGLDPITLNDNGSAVSGIFVRTSAGSRGLYYIDGVIAGITGSPTLFTASNNLETAAGGQVMVNRITSHGAGPAGTDVGQMVVWDDGQRTEVQIWAATSKGVFASVCAVNSFNWRATGGQGNLGDLDLAAVASAPARAVLGQAQTQVFAITASELYQSNDGLFHFVPMLSRLLDAGPAFWARTKAGFGEYPRTSFATLRVPDKGAGPYTLTRQVDGLGHIEYIAVNPASTAPSWAHRDPEIPELSTAALVPEIPLSELLIKAACRFLAFTADPQEILMVESSFKDTADPLRTLRPTQLVTVNGPVKFYKGSGDITFIDYVNEPFYVLEHTIRVTGTGGQGEGPNRAHTSTKLGKLLIDSRSDPLRVTADMAYALSRQQMYRSKGH